MSVDEAQPRRPPRPPGDAKLVRYDEYIDKQIRSTSRTVKAVDFATAIVVLVAAVLAFLLTVAVVEHWLVPGGFNFAARCALFGLLVAGASWFAYRRIWPLCLRAINPVYAAQTIEHVSPSLKNSLINLLLFRQRRSDISDAVYQTLEEQAAQRLTRVPIDSSVDHTKLIRFGYVLLAIVAVGALYKVFSPKDPLIAAERVLMPWAEIVPASRVSIKNVEPGRVTITRGEFLDVSAEVVGIGENDPVLLRFTTTDGRAVNKSITMKPSNAGLRFIGRLPDATEENGSSGVAQNLTYRIEAGDARSLDYKVDVIAAPAILVEQIDYDYPPYTGFVDRTIEASRDVPDPGQIRAIEGTRVTIHARANGPIDTADVDFDADGRRDLRMSIDGERAKAAFELTLRDDRQTPQHLSYVLRLTNDAGRTNRDPVKYPIEVVPDYAPEVAVQSPPEKSLNVRLDDTIVIEVEASDPDFALSDVRLRGETAGRPKIDVPLMADNQQPRKFTGRYRFTPRAHKLQPGDNVKYWIVAVDIRSPKPNSTATEERYFRIVSPDPAQQPPPDRIAQRDQRQQQGGQNGQEGEKQQQRGQGQQGAKGNQGGENGQQQQGESGQQKGNENKSSDSKQQNQGQGGPPNGGGESASEDGKNDGQQDGKNGKNGAEDGPARSQEKKGQDSQNGKQNQQGSGQQQSDGKQTGAGAAGGESPQQGSQPASTRQPAQPDAGSARPDQGQKSQGAGSNQQNGSPSESKPVSPEGDDDGTAFDRIREHMQKNGEMKESESDSQNPSDQKQNGESTSADGKQKQQGQSASNGNQKQNGTEQSPAGDTQQPSSRDAQRSAGKEKGDAKQNEKQDGQSTKADGAEEKSPRNDDQGKGTGADTRQDDVPQRQEKPSEMGEKEKSPGGQQTSTKGESGAGEQPGENQGVPDSKEGMKPSEKRQQSSSQESKNDDKEPPAPGEGKRESDSQGEMGGDRPGGGEEGGGQKTNRDGTGSAGQNQSADEGGGESSEKGAGNNSPNAGQDAKADHRTGQPGSDKQQGQGSKQQDGQGNKPGGKAAGGDDPAHSGEKPQAGNQQGKEKKPGESTSADGKQNENGNGNQAGKKPDESASKGNQSQDGKQGQDGQQPNGGGTANGGGGDTGATAGAPPAADGTAPDGDAANLDYARRQTDLVLEKLADQLNRKRVDEKILKELGWTEDDLRAFVERWQRRKDAARNADPAAEAARRELDDALRSLGLRRGKLQQNKVQEDRTRDLREGYRGPVPLEYQERLRAYNQGISRAQQERE